MWRRAATGPGVEPEGYPRFPADGGVRCFDARDPDDTVGELFATDAEFEARGLVDLAAAFRDFAAADGVLRFGRSLVIGPEAIYDLYFGTPDNEKLTWDPQFGGAAASNDLGWSAGPAAYTIHDPAGDLVFRNKYLTVWQRDAAGAWKYPVDGGASAP
jgi:hypothetical protein